MMLFKWIFLWFILNIIVIYIIHKFLEGTKKTTKKSDVVLYKYTSNSIIPPKPVFPKGRIIREGEDKPRNDY